MILSQDKQGEINYQLKTWAPRDLDLQKIVERIQKNCETFPDHTPWEDYIREGQQLLQAQEANFERPPVASDRLYMNIGDNQVGCVMIYACMCMYGNLFICVMLTCIYLCMGIFKSFCIYI